MVLEIRFEYFFLLRESLKNVYSSVYVCFKNVITRVCFKMVMMMIFEQIL